jgi:hypothetical protein
MPSPIATSERADHAGRSLFNSLLAISESVRVAYSGLEDRRSGAAPVSGFLEGGGGGSVELFLDLPIVNPDGN